MNRSMALQLKVDELLVVLDKDIELIQNSLVRIGELRECLIRRQQETMDSVLGMVRADAEQRSANDIVRERIRAELSGILGCDVKKMTIGALGNYLSEQQRDRLFEKRGTLLILTKKLSKEYLLTQKLVKTYSKLHRRFFEKVFYSKNKNQSVYNSSGQVDRDADSSFMNVKL